MCTLHQIKIKNDMGMSKVYETVGLVNGGSVSSQSGVANLKNLNSNELYDLLKAANQEVTLLDMSPQFIPNRYVTRIGGRLHPRIYSGYTESGIHVIALAPFTTPESFDYAAAVNIVRGEENEAGLLTEYMRDNVWDIYIEDLTNKRKIFFVDYYYNGQKFPFPDMAEHPATKKYNRLSTDNSVLNDRCWYLFEGSLEKMTLKIDGEYVDLYNFYSDF
jgi:hypothetical protein